LKFKPVFKDKIWGGQKIRTTLGLDFSPLPNCGEAWVLSGVPGNQTVVSNGFLAGNELNEILEIYMDELIGEKAYEQYGNEFPVLVKLIDANDFLSVQVHPDDALAVKRQIGRGKTEMWYILDALPDATLITGFNRAMNAPAYLESMREKRLRDILRYEKVEKGDAFFIPAGRVHALGPGILLAEIQQTSDTTYRIYDWDRLDSKGQPRELHVEEALEAINFGDSDPYHLKPGPVPGGITDIFNCPWFSTGLVGYTQDTERDYSDLDSCVIVLCVEGRGMIRTDNESVSLTSGEVVLFPAMTEKTLILPDPNMKVLEVSIP
jgi:mannose-6-phosphate isomerase